MNVIFEGIKSTLIAEAERQNAMWPQYKGHWSGPEWTLFVVRKDVKTKLGLAFKLGDIVLGKEHGLIESGPYEGQISYTCYSSRNKIDTALRACHVMKYRS
jgi:hypothetical protein